MPGPLIVRIKKSADGTTALTCTRPDGTTTWQRQEKQLARFFPRHDLTHYAVETVLRHTSGFYGLVAQGWDLSDFGKPWPRGPLPVEANLVEHVVGFFDRDRSTGHLGNADELNTEIAAFAAEHGIEAPGKLTDADLAAVRRRRGEVFALWDAVAPGQALELPFEVGFEHSNRPR